MSKAITIKELRRQLEYFEKLGYGDGVLMYLTEDNKECQLEEGVWNVYPKENYPNQKVTVVHLVQWGRGCASRKERTLNVARATIKDNKKKS